MIESASMPPASPCVRNCCLDENDICLGCGRALAEILQWHQADPTLQLEINQRARMRLDAKHIQ